jgi:hypothetical protein
MRKSIVLLILAALTAAVLATGCMPNGEGIASFAPRSFPYSPAMAPDPNLPLPKMSTATAPPAP